MLLQHMPSFGSWRVPGNRQMSKPLTVQPLPQHLQKSAKISKLAPYTVRPSREGNRDATRALVQPLQLLHHLLSPQRSMPPLSLEGLLRGDPSSPRTPLCFSMESDPPLGPNSHIPKAGFSQPTMASRIFHTLIFPGMMETQPRRKPENKTPSLFKRS